MNVQSAPDYEVFIEQPEGFVRTGNKGENFISKLKKSLYGLKQIGRNWNSLLNK